MHQFAHADTKQFAAAIGAKRVAHVPAGGDPRQLRLHLTQCLAAFRSQGVDEFIEEAGVRDEDPGEVLAPGR